MERHKTSKSPFFSIVMPLYNNNSVSSAENTISITRGGENKTAALPGILWVIIIAPGATIFGGKPMLGFKVSGLAWFIPLVFATLTIIRNPRLTQFPLWI